MSESDRIPTVSVIIPIHNGEKWIEECFNSIVDHNPLPDDETFEISVYDDGSTDKTSELIKEWKEKINPRINIIISGSCDGSCKGVGYAKNRAVAQSKGQFLCFQDIDDLMLPGRIFKQLEVAKQHPYSIVGSCFKRIPDNSTTRFTNWANNLSEEALCLQVYTSHGPTVIMPTWFCSRKVFDRVGGFCEDGKGVPEDLIFFYKHLDLNGGVERVNDVLLVYRHHPGATTLSISEETIWDIRIRRLEEKILKNWTGFCIWNAGKQGRKLFRSLMPENRKKVTSFCDVDIKKIGTCYEPYRKLINEPVSSKIPIVHFKDANKPFVICVKLDMTCGVFENNLKSLNLFENVDYILFS